MLKFKSIILLKLVINLIDLLSLKFLTTTLLKYY